MIRKRTYVFICAILLSSLTLQAHPTEEPATPRDTVQMRSLANRLLGRLLPTDDPLFGGIAIGVDALGSGLAAFSTYGEYGVMARVNLKQKVFPVVEAGLGVCNRTDDATDIHLKLSAPYFRVGCDYNFLKDVASRNRIFGGLRMAYTSFSYDIDAPAMSDPVWHDQTSFVYQDVKSNMLWAELVFGLEAKIWRNFHLGWNLRYKRRLHQKVNPPGQAWYVPGYGKNDTSAWGGTFNLIFEL
ncbi:MAG: hypothetical protein IJ786_03735 [Bacteroidaceae bacterium]|nr:hypothetical protein [Bacteroidaceae bacterium]